MSDSHPPAMPVLADVLANEVAMRFDLHQDEVVVSGLSDDGEGALAFLPVVDPSTLGSAAFRRRHSASLAYMAGAMANGISSARLTEAGARHGFLAPFGSAGMAPESVRDALRTIPPDLRARIAVNVVASRGFRGYDEQIVRVAAELGVPTIEFSAYVDISPQMIVFRHSAPGRRIMVKTSSPALVERLLRPPGSHLLSELVANGRLTAAQAEGAARRPVADDIVIEGDSGGHTDQKPLSILLQAALAARRAASLECPAAREVCIGAAGGIGTPDSVADAFNLGADFVVTGSINQTAVEAGTSDTVKQMLASAGISDTSLCQAGDMLTTDAQVQVLARGTLFAARARRLKTVLTQHANFADLPAEIREWFESDLFGTDVDEAWRCYVGEHFGVTTEFDPESRDMLLLLVQSYFSASSRWAIAGTPGRAADYQVWCGPSMGAFNQWVRGSGLEALSARTVGSMAVTLMDCAARLQRIRALRSSTPGFGSIPSALTLHEIGRAVAAATREGW